MIFAIKLKKYIISASIFSIDASKPCYKKRSCPIILFKINKSSKIGVYFAILPLNLAIYLRIEGH